MYYKGYLIEHIPDRDEYRICLEESQENAVAYADSKWEAKKRIDELPDVYKVSSDGYEVETCPHCGNEIELRWNINELGFRAFCPICGGSMMLCDACQHRHGELHDDCDFMKTNEDGCRFYRPADWWEEDDEE